MTDIIKERIIESSDLINDSFVQRGARVYNDQEFIECCEKIIKLYNYLNADETGISNRSCLDPAYLANYLFSGEENDMMDIYMINQETLKAFLNDSFTYSKDAYSPYLNKLESKFIL